MTTYTKKFYSIGEVSQMLEVPIYTLRFWEDSFPMFNPNRSAKGTRRFTPSDIDLAKFIKETLYEKGLKIERAIDYVNKIYRKQPPRNLRKCNTHEDAIILLEEVKKILGDAHSVAKIESVVNWIKESNTRTHKNIRGKEYFM